MLELAWTAVTSFSLLPLRLITIVGALTSVALLKYYSNKNKKNLNGIKTNDYIIGIGYTGMMDSNIIKLGLRKIGCCNITEALIHPCKYDVIKDDSHSLEYAITKDMELKEKIRNLGFDLTNYKNLVLEDVQTSQY